MPSRAERRRETRKNQKLTKWLLKLDSDQRQLLTEYCIESTKSDILAFGRAFERVLRVRFQQDIFNDELEAEEYLKMIIDEVELESNTMRKFKNGSVEYMANIKAEKENIIELYRKNIQSGLNEKETFAELKTAYPMFTANAIKNVVAEYKREKKAEKRAKESNVEKKDFDTEEIARQIVNIGGVIDDENNANTEEKEGEGKIIPQEEKKDSQAPSDTQEKVRKSKLVETTPVREFTGEFGTYKKLSNGTIKLGESEFKTIDDIEAARKESEKEIKAEIEEFNKKISEKRIKVYGRSNEMIELLSI